MIKLKENTRETFLTTVIILEDMLKVTINRREIEEIKKLQIINMQIINSLENVENQSIIKKLNYLVKIMNKEDRSPAEQKKASKILHTFKFLELNMKGMINKEIYCFQEDYESTIEKFIKPENVLNMIQEMGGAA